MKPVSDGPADKGLVIPTSSAEDCLPGSSPRTSGVLCAVIDEIRPLSARNIEGPAGEVGWSSIRLDASSNPETPYQITNTSVESKTLLPERSSGSRVSAGVLLLLW